MKNKKIFFVLLIFLLIVISLNTQIVYAQTEAEELKELLDEYEEDLGDLNQFKKVVDETYNDLYAAEKVDDALKEKLNADIDKLGDIDGINPLIKSILYIELKSQVSNLTDENINEMREEISIIKEWVDAKLGYNENNSSGANINDKEEQKENNYEQTIEESPVKDKTVSNQFLPKAGIKSMISIILIMLSISAIISIVKYIKWKEIK